MSPIPDLAVALDALVSFVQPQSPTSMCPCMMQMGGGQGMMGGMWFGMVLVTLLIVAIIAALVALTIYLVRRSRPTSPPRPS